jgi:hypothetical protein
MLSFQKHNGDLALVNGSSAILHSFNFSDGIEYQRIHDLVHGKSSPPYGTIIDTESPTTLNMEINQTLDNKPPSTRRLQQMAELQKHSIITDNIVIPIAAARYSQQDGRKYFYHTSTITSPFATASVAELFPYQLAFAMTIHKAQVEQSRKWSLI